ncbi:MAG: hypothetical protein K6G26_08340, partial [Lachnospiraceae bacterium]|nr:hypothetical protein [Lachnospiraceae bacterium]
MNKTLSHHFKCINDDKYSKILLDIVKRLSRLKEMSRDNDIVDVMDELDIMYSELDYLLIYVKNIGRMGYVSKKADDELCKLYSIMDDIDTVLASTIKSIKNKPRENDKVQKYYYYIEKIWEDVQGQDDVSGDISRSLEKYLEIMNEEIDGVSLSEIWKKYKGSKNSFMEISKNVINKLFQQKVTSLSSLYIDIKKHQLEKIKMLGYHDSLEYIARKYAVDTQSIEVMVENAHTFISKVLKDNISFDWAQSGILSELRK